MAGTVHGFNTGRQYTAMGQRIGWQRVDSGERVIFADFDRMIYGEFTTDPATPVTDSYVLNMYDRNHYSMSCEAMQLRSDGVEFKAFR